MTVAFDQIPTISVGETRIPGCHFGDMLKDGDLLTGTPTATQVDTTELTVSSVALTTAAVTIGGISRTAKTAVTFTVSGQLANKSYTILVTVSSVAGKTLKRDARFRVK